MTLTLLPKNKLEAAFKKVISKDNNRPILQAIHFDKDGSLTATDSHVLLRINSAHSLEKDFNFDLAHFTESKDGDYPETKRLIPITFEQELRLNPAEFHEILPTLKAMKYEQPVKIRNVPGKSILEISSEISAVKLNYTGAPVSDKAIIDITVNPIYLTNMLDFYSWYCPKGVNLNLGYSGSLRPMAFQALDATYLITPIRTF